MAKTIYDLVTTLLGTSRLIVKKNTANEKLNLLRTLRTRLT